MRGLRPAAMAMVVMLLAPLLVALPQPATADEDPAPFKAAQDELAPGLDDAGLVPMSAGSSHTCAIGADGNAYCWGNNDHGQLGDSTTEQRATPTQVSTGTVETFTQLTAGGNVFDVLNTPFTCGLATDGTAHCWGNNDHGQLGDGTIASRTTPTQVSTGTVETFSQLTAGNEHSCGLGADGAAYCWGQNRSGQLGDSTTINRSTPTAVSTGTVATFTQLTAGGFHTCGLDADGAAYCWGANSNGRTGFGESSENQTTPSAVSTGTVATFTQLTAGEAHTCGLDEHGTAYCWGWNGSGQLGDDTTVDRSAPTQVTTTASFTQLAAGWSHTCGLAADGAAYCWGSNDFGQLGDGTTASRTTATAVTTDTLATFSQLSAGQDHTCGGAAEGGAVYCWGRNNFGQLGDGTVDTDRLTSTLVVAGAFTLPPDDPGSGPPPAGPSPSPTPAPSPAPVPVPVVVPRVPGVGGGSIDGVEASLVVRPVVDDDQDTPPVAEGQQPTGVEVTGEVDGNPFAIVLEPADEAGERGSGAVVGTQLRLTRGEGVRTRLSGFAANSSARLSILSEPRELGTFTTDGAGNLARTVRLLPDDITACQHTLQVQGTLTGGQQVTAELGVWVLANPFPFPDVAPASTHAPAIGCLTDLDVVVGFQDGGYNQQQPTSRGQAATILTRLQRPETAGMGRTRSIEAGVGRVEAEQAAGILNGFGDNTVRPHAPLTREQAASLLAAAAKLSPDPDAAGGFPDAGTTHAGALGALLTADGLTGFADGTLRPDQPVTRGQFATMVVRLRGLLQPDPDPTD